MAFSKTWDETKPAGADDVAQGDDEIRDFKFATRERLAVDHYFLASEGGDTKIGYHKFVTMIDQSTPAAVADAVRMYSKVVGSESEIHVIDESSNEYQLTHEQRLWIAALRVASEARGDTIVRGASLWGRVAVGAAGTYWKSDGTDPSWGAFELLNNHEAKNATGDANKSTFSIGARSADRTITVPDEDMNFGQQLIKGWINMDGSGTVGINDSFNVSSIVDNGTGDYTINWDTDFANANYAVAAFASHVTAEQLYVHYRGSSGWAVGSMRVNSCTHNGTATDADVLTLIAIGDR